MDLAVALRAFLRTVERGSVTAAARDLGVSQPAVTKHLRNLEAHVGARLLERSSRVVRPTTQGQALYEGGRSGLATIEAALDGVRRDMGAIEGLLRLHAPSCIGAKHFHRIVMAFQAKYPAVTIDLILENRHIDLIYENFDLAVRYGRPEGQALVIRRLGLVRRILVASPAYLKRVGPINSLQRLSQVDIIVTPAVALPRDTLPLQRKGKPIAAPVRSVLCSNDAQVIANTLLQGHVAGPVQRLLVEEELADGRLVHILPDYEVRPAEAFIVYPSVRFMRPVVRAFTDFAVPLLRAIDGLDTEEGPAAAVRGKSRAKPREGLIGGRKRVA